jgi:Lon protease-like protein
MSELASSLPGRFPVFPLRGALLLPGGNLPLNIFEPRYLQMVRDAMQTDRVIGMIQPKAEAAEGIPPELYRTGCVGRITNFSETGDGRFDVASELEVATPYRQVLADFAGWRQDLQPAPPPGELKAGLAKVLRVYFDRHGIEADWSAIANAPLAGLVTSLCMICPFEPEEKQALLEARDCGRQARLLIALMEMEALAEPGGSSARH